MPDTGRKELGKKGEAFAAQYLSKRGYRIVDVNYRSRFGEIDIIALDKKTYCFVEVKTRTSSDQGHPFESITPAKQKQIARVALGYLQEKEKLDALARFDVIALWPNQDGGFEVELLKNAFEAE